MRTLVAVSYARALGRAASVALLGIFSLPLLLAWLGPLWDERNPIAFKQDGEHPRDQARVSHDRLRSFAGGPSERRFRSQWIPLLQEHVWRQARGASGAARVGLSRAFAAPFRSSGRLFVGRDRESLLTISRVELALGFSHVLLRQLSTTGKTLRPSDAEGRLGTSWDRFARRGDPDGGPASRRYHDVPRPTTPPTRDAFRLAPGSGGTFLQAREHGGERADDDAHEDAEFDTDILLKRREDAGRNERRQGDDWDTEPDVEVREAGRARSGPPGPPRHAAAILKKR